MVWSVSVVKEWSSVIFVKGIVDKNARRFGLFIFLVIFWSHNKSFQGTEQNLGPLYLQKKKNK